MTDTKKFKDESQDARRHDKHNITHPEDNRRKLREKPPQVDKRK